MRVIDQTNWPRRDHFLLYNSMQFPHIGLTLQVDITELWKNRPKFKYSPTISLIYLINKAANQVSELRQRIHGDQVIEHELIHTTLAVLGKNDVFGVCYLPFDDRFTIFAAEAEKRLESAKKAPSMNDFHINQQGDITRDDILSISVLPWLSFTSFDLTRLPSADSVPFLALGKITPSVSGFTLPFFVSFHHALVDGLHISRFIEHLQQQMKEFSSVNI